MQLSPLIQELIQALKVLPGVGPKSAQRMAFHLLERERHGGERLGNALLQAMTDVQHCQQCRIFTEQPLCAICASAKRQATRQLCVVESPADVLALEQTGQFQGMYFVLMGRLSPIDGIGPQDIGLDILAKRLAQDELDEVILATNPTVEGETTAYYIADLCQRHQVQASRIAHGVPVGGELEYLDGTTLSFAFQGRKPLFQ